jgi:uncharacterized membrane protein
LEVFFMIRRTAYFVVFCAIALALILTGLLSSRQVKAAQIDREALVSAPVLNADGQAAETLELTTQFPVLSSYAGISYSFDVALNYKGSGSKVFDLKATVPQGFNYTIAPGYGSAGGDIAAIRLDGTKGYPDSVKLSITPYAWQVPAPGSYPITLDVSSGDLKASIKLTAVVTANYDMKLSTPDGRLNTEATAGQDNHFTVVLTNTGSGNLDKVSISCPAKDRPNGWTVTASPDKIDSFKAGDSKEIQITLRPSEKTIAGDYIISVQAEPDARNAYANLQIRVTALTPTIWGWVGVGIVILVIVALAAIFIRFGRR